MRPPHQLCVAPREGGHAKSLGVFERSLGRGSLALDRELRECIASGRYFRILWDKTTAVVTAIWSLFAVFVTLA